ncbi:hypothetical protein AYR46_21440 [Sphingobium yanoikuyae]|uniref:hypothetical protein n=1 Tax=Sphingobium yanoikuyae TaxID=13690 RepID=UPI0007A731B7|nr:hypothetical protein [Sphingobium yanoikuyae]KZC75316.1 hypothetical protein AYR46_21440 [Sphingobium yanoikuyae]
MNNIDSYTVLMLNEIAARAIDALRYSDASLTPEMDESLRMIRDEAERNHKNLIKLFAKHGPLIGQIDLYDEELENIEKFAKDAKNGLPDDIEIMSAKIDDKDIPDMGIM